MADEPVDEEPEEKRVTIKFNPFAFTIEQNNEFIARGYEPVFPSFRRGDL